MFKSIYLSEEYLHDHKLRAEAKRVYELTAKNVERIKDIALRVIKYPDFREAFEYVDGLFPRVNVKEIPIYKVAAKDLMRMGYGHAEGFYDSISKIIVVCGVRPSHRPVNRRFHIQAKIETDDVIVHELCHYCYYFEGRRSISSEMREEFAYGWSVGYLRQKGLTDEEIVKHNFLPYMIGLSYEEARKNVMVKNGVSTYEYNNHTKFQRKEFRRTFAGKMFDRAKEIGMERGLCLVECYSKKLQEGTGLIDEQDDTDRFDILDL